jgi:hypothetical protein
VGLYEDAYRVYGTVTTDVPGGPIQGATVKLENKQGYVIDTTATDASGNYTFYNVAVEQGYGLRAPHDGYKNYYSGANIGISTGNVERNFTLQASTYDVSGTIYLGTTITRASYSTVRLANNSRTYNATTDSSGEYEFEDVPAGTYTLEASYYGYITGTRSYVEVNANITGKDLTLALAAYSVRGVISVSDSGSGGSPNGAKVQLRQSGSPAGSPATANNSGSYTINGVAVGTYTIEASLTGYTSNLSESFAVSAANVTGKNLTLQNIPDATPTITGQTLTNALESIRTSSAGGEYLIELGQSETNVADYDITSFTMPITITVDGGGHNIAMSSSATAHYITVKSGVTLIIRNITLTGVNTSTSARSLVYIESGGVFKMESGTLTGNFTNYGGAVYANEDGDFVMTGGTITGNKSSNRGHGVYVTGGTMTMTGGSITNNASINGYVNDITIASNGSLTLSGSANIGRIWLFNSSGTTLSITIPGAFSGQNIIIDLRNPYRTSFENTQILKGDGLSAALSKFSLGNSKVGILNETDSGIGDLTDAGYSIDSDGYLRKAD